MSPYTEEKNKETMDEQNKIIDELGLSVVDMEKERRNSLLWFVTLIAIGLCCLGFCLVVYGG
jgi:hypothetical protein